jgi:chromosomal replication initiation ATPase DnaA
MLITDVEETIACLRQRILRAVINGVRQEWNVEESLILGETRPEEVIQPRHCAMSIFYRLANLPPLTTSLSDVARLFNRKNHCTVLNALKMVRNRRETDPVFRDRYSRVLRALCADNE